jgi:hypothetical protein
VWRAALTGTKQRNPSESQASEGVLHTHRSAFLVEPGGHCHSDGTRTLVGAVSPWVFWTVGSSMRNLVNFKGGECSGN